VVTGGGSLGTGLTDALAAAGATVTEVPPVLPPTEAGYRDAMAAISPDVVVFAWVPDRCLEPSPLASLDDAAWERRCEEPIRAALFTALAAHPHLRGRDGRLVLVCGSVALDGAAGLVPYASAAEAQRLLAKSAARQWGADGITVNVVAPPVTALAASLADACPDAARERPALATDALRSVADATVWLASPAAAGITGATILADGGALMAP
jgi:NAD(P)-dependent dehydrogenase (short-subunit alcohol dehydrogenase family)